MPAEIGDRNRVMDDSVSREKDEPTLWLKFSGELLDVRSVPIYELGDTLIALQRIVYKASIQSNNRLNKYAQLTQDERKRLALQIAGKEKSSDLYALVPFMADAAVRQYLISLLKMSLGALGRYALKSVISGANRETSVRARDVEGSVLIGAIYADTHSTGVAELLSQHFTSMRFS